jgi:dienelactone hydrolase
MMEPGLDDAGAVEAAAIPVERCTGPVLLVSGGDDHVWPTARMCAMVEQRMSIHGRGDEIRHLNYPRAGHKLFPYSRPPDTLVPKMSTDFGGSPAHDAAAHADAWPRVLACLRSNSPTGR